MSTKSKRWAMVLVSALVSVPALATVVAAQSFEEMTRAAPLVVHARMGRSQASWDDSHHRIETFTEAVVLEPLKGAVAVSSVLMVRQPGGVVGKLGMKTEGVARFAEGEEVVLFLEPAPDDAHVYLTSGLGAGKVTLGTNGLGEKRALRDVSGLTFLHKGERKTRLSVINRPEDLGTPEQFIARIKKATGGSR